MGFRCTVVDEVYVDRRRLVVGGDHCDACNKTLEELGLPKLRSCGRFGRAYYCSEECQREQWHLRHKKACRKAGQIEAGDIIVIRGIDSRPEYNGNLARIIGHNSTSSRWNVKVLDEEEEPVISVKADKLHYLRPEK